MIRLPLARLPMLVAHSSRLSDFRSEDGLNGRNSVTMYLSCGMPHCNRALLRVAFHGTLLCGHRQYDSGNIGIASVAEL